MILLRLSPIICSRDIFGLSRDLEFVSRDLEGISGGRGLIWRGDCVWWFLWFDWLKPLKKSFILIENCYWIFYRSRSASQYSSPLRYIRYPQSSFETFACSIQTSSSGFHRARVIPLKIWFKTLIREQKIKKSVKSYVWNIDEMEYPFFHSRANSDQGGQRSMDPRFVRHLRFFTNQKKHETMSVWAGWSECEWWKKPHSANSATVGWIEVSFCREIGNVEIRSLKGQMRSK